MAFYLIGSYINSIDDSTMQQLNAMSDPAANIYQESLIKGFFNCGIELIPYSFKVVSKKLYSQYSLFYKSWCSLYPNVYTSPVVLNNTLWLSPAYILPIVTGTSI